jgi:hypothetical protein
MLFDSNLASADNENLAADGKVMKACTDEHLVTGWVEISGAAGPGLFKIPNRKTEWCLRYLPSKQAVV